MVKFTKSKKLQVVEAVFWILLILATIIVVTKFQWTVASYLLQFLGAAALLVSVYYYLRNRTLYQESKQKTEQLAQQQRELRNRKKTIDMIFENSADGILILDENKKIEEFSPGLEKITGYTRDEALGRNAQQLLKFSAEKDRSLLPDMMFTMLGANQNDQYVENTLISKIGQVVDIEASHTLIHDEHAKKIMAMAIIRDITYEKNLIARDKEFITVTSHQLNTPLSIIRGYASLLNSGKAGDMNQKQATFVKEILSATEKMIALTNSMLSISRIEQEKIKLDISDVNIAELINSQISMFAHAAESKNVNLASKIDNPDTVIMADQEKLKQAISNIIDNAIKYTQKGRVTVSVVDRPQVVDIMIADTGIGIPSTELEKIGTRFYRSQNAIDVDNHGTGLGFFIAQTIIDKHHGQMHIESKVGQFTKVIVTLPKKQPLE